MFKKQPKSERAKTVIEVAKHHQAEISRALLQAEMTDDHETALAFLCLAKERTAILTGFLEVSK